MPLDALLTDESRWPIVIHRTVGIPSEAQVDAFIDRATAHVMRGETFAVIFDNSQSGRATAYIRKRATEWLETYERQLGANCVGTALVFRSAALRFVMSTVMLVVSHPVPHQVCGTLEEAIRWSEAQLRSRAERRAG
jgi:hypothetical protein